MEETPITAQMIRRHSTAEETAAAIEAYNSRRRLMEFSSSLGSLINACKRKGHHEMSLEQIWHEEDLVIETGTTPARLG